MHKSEGSRQCARQNQECEDVKSYMANIFVECFNMVHIVMCVGQLTCRVWSLCGVLAAAIRGPELQINT